MSERCTCPDARCDIHGPAVQQPTPDHRRVLREMLARHERHVGSPSHSEWMEEECREQIAALTAALAALDGTRLKQDAERIETQRAQYAHLALKHDATEKRLTAALEDRARLRERIEAERSAANERAAEAFATSDTPRTAVALQRGQVLALEWVLTLLPEGEPFNGPTAQQLREMCERLLSKLEDEEHEECCPYTQDPSGHEPGCAIHDAKALLSAGEPPKGET